MKIVLIMLSFAMRYLFLSIHFLKHKGQTCLKGTRRGQISPTSTQANVFRESVHARGDIVGVSKRVQFEDAIFYNYCVWNSLWISVWNAKKLA